MKTFFLILFITYYSGSLKADPIEEMEYTLRFGFIKGGKATLIAKEVKLNKEPIIHYFMRGRTTGIVDKIYEVNDVYESWVDPSSSLPVKSIRNVQEQKYRFYDVVTYNRKEDSLYSQKLGAKKVPKNINDLISIFFYIRQNKYFDEVLAGKNLEIPVFHGNDLFMFQLEYLGLETINTKIGRRQCYVVSPKVPKGKLFKDSNSLKIYITKDENKLPIYAEFELLLGSLKCELELYRINGKDQLTK